MDHDTIDNARAAYAHVRARFVRDTVTIDNVRCPRMTDPVLGITLCVEPKAEAMLPWLFKEHWTNCVG
jgi:hypothetical protein